MASVMTLVRLRALTASRVRPLQPLGYPRFRHLSVFSFIRNITATHKVQNTASADTTTPKPKPQEDDVPVGKQDAGAGADAESGVSGAQHDERPAPEEKTSTEPPSEQNAGAEAQPASDQKKQALESANETQSDSSQREQAVESVSLTQTETETVKPEKSGDEQASIAIKEETMEVPTSFTLNDRNDADGIDASRDITAQPTPSKPSSSPSLSPTEVPQESQQQPSSPPPQQNTQTWDALETVEPPPPALDNFSKALEKETAQNKPANAPASGVPAPPKLPTFSMTPTSGEDSLMGRPPIIKNILSHPDPGAPTVLTSAASGEDSLAGRTSVVRKIISHPDPRPMASEIQLKAWGTTPAEDLDSGVQVPIIASASSAAAVTPPPPVVATEGAPETESKTEAQSSEKSSGEKSIFRKITGKVSEIATGKQADAETPKEKPDSTDTAPKEDEKKGSGVEEKKERPGTTTSKSEQTSKHSADEPADAKPSNDKADTSEPPASNEPSAPEEEVPLTKAQRKAHRRAERVKLAEAKLAAKKAQAAADQAKQQAAQAAKAGSNAQDSTSKNSQEAATAKSKEGETQTKPTDKPEAEKSKSEREAAEAKAKEISEKFAAEMSKAEKARAEKAKAEKAAAEKAKAQKAALEAQKNATVRADVKKAVAEEKARAAKAAAADDTAKKERRRMPLVEEDEFGDFEDIEPSVNRRAKYYAVKFGYNPGIYYQWSDCQAQIEGYDSPIYKAFDSLVEADEFMRAPGPKPWGPPPTKARFYGVQRGRVPGVYTSWAEARDQVTDHPEPRYRKFGTFEEAEEFVKLNEDYVPQSEEFEEADEADFGASSQASAPVEYQFQTDQRNNTVEIVTPAFTLRVSPHVNSVCSASVEGGPSTAAERPSAKAAGKLPESAQLLYTLPEQRVVAASRKKEVPVYTDGACSGNGRVSGRAGIGVYFGPNDLRNIAEPLSGTRQTSARAELAAIARALEIVRRDFNIAVFSDSKYAVNCLTNWYVGWQRNNWKTSDGRPVENKDIIQYILQKIEEREKLSASTRFEWVRGHNRNKWNELADKLANDGVRKALAMQ
ncbi:replication factor A protein 2 [Ascosphaera pollenicola]|nr:replication factor A protein 2 [Ascosphaera pollenicola]